MFSLSSFSFLLLLLLHPLCFFFSFPFFFFFFFFFSFPVLSLSLVLGQWVMTTNERFQLPYAEWCEDNSGAWEDDRFYGKMMMFTIVVMYLTKIVPDCLFSFFRSLGDGNDAHSKIMSLRKNMWERGDDFNLGQMVGYKCDLYMNTGYVCILYTLNLFILFATDSVLEMLLDAIAMNFILDLDEDFASAEWWDPNRRWARGGALELVLGTTLRKSCLESSEKFEKYFGVPEVESAKVSRRRSNERLEERRRERNTRESRSVSKATEKETENGTERTNEVRQQCAFYEDSC